MRRSSTSAMRSKRGSIADDCARACLARVERMRQEHLLARAVAALALVGCWQCARAAPQLPQASVVPGGVLMLPMDANTVHAPIVTFDGHRVLVLKVDESWLAIVGLPLTAEPGTARGAGRTRGGL